MSVRDLLRLPAGPVEIDAMDASATPGAPGGKRATLAELDVRAQELFDWGERLWAEGSSGGRRRVLLVLQGMDACGKGGTIKHVVRQLNPLACRITAFGPPSTEEREEHFLWRIRKRVPRPGEIGVFDRSHYEDVVAARVRELVPEAVWRGRFDEIQEFERELVGRGVVLVKAFLHISYEEQARRQLARLDDPTKRWKFSASDLDDRALWPRYAEAYDEALDRCRSDDAPWYVVPADRKWYRKWAVQSLLLETLREMAPEWPAREDLDDEALRARLEATLPSGA